MSVKIQMDVPALERLIGGDSEVEVELRKGVVENFARSRLRGLLSDDRVKGLLREATDAITKLRNDLTQQIAALFTQEFGEWKKEGTFYGAKNIFHPHPEVKAKLTDEARMVAKATALEIRSQTVKDVEEIFQKQQEAMIARAERRAQELVDAEFERRVQEEIARRIAALASRG
jgi:hypothetical protein